MVYQRSKEQISHIMRQVKSEHTKPEVAFRKALWARGVRYRLHDSGLPGKPDIVIPRARLVIFVDGDYWHGNQWRTRGHESLKSQFVASPRAEYWVSKISGNMHRDRSNTTKLIADGWRVLRFWETDISSDLENCVETAIAAIDQVGAFAGRNSFQGNTVAEFFAGIGLMRWALERKGWQTLFANDIDPLKFDMYRANFPDAAEHFSPDDVHQLSADDVPTVSLATASFPCNDLSLAGSMKGLSGEHSGAFWGFIRVLKEMGDRRPPMILLENVIGWLTSHRGTDFRDSLLALNALGYECDALALNASSFTPQSRPRLFVVATRSVSPAARVAETPVFYQSKARPKQLADYIFAHPEIQWKIRPLPSPPSSTRTLADIIEDLPPDSPEWWSRERAAYFLAQMSERHAVTAKEMIAGKEYTYGTAFRRVRHGRSMAELRTDGIAGCLRTPRGGSGRQILFKAGKGEHHVRLLTPRECARLQGVDDSYVISVPPNQALFGFGDAVCVPAIEWIAENYLNPLITELIHGSVVYRVAMEA